MKPTARPRLKICCIASIDEAWMAIDAGASAIGLVSAMPSGPGPIPEDLIAEIAAAAPPGVSSFLLTCKEDVASIIDQQRRLRVNTIQICDRLPPGSHRELREALPGVSLVQVIHVTGPESVDEAIAVAPDVDADPVGLRKSIVSDQGTWWHWENTRLELESEDSRGDRCAGVSSGWAKSFERCRSDSGSSAVWD